MDGDNSHVHHASVRHRPKTAPSSSRCVEDHEATLKTIERRGSQIALIPSNKDFETRLLPANSVKVQGRLVGLLRRY